MRYVNKTAFLPSIFFRTVSRLFDFAIAKEKNLLVGTRRFFSGSGIPPD
jgi:hypothetical protein